MSETSDRLMNVLFDGICGDIRFALKHGRNRAALILIYSGIDAMSSLEKNSELRNVKDRFVNWINEYMHFQDWPEAGMELYGARCGILHTYGPFSDLSDAGRVRPIGYTTGTGVAVMQSEVLVLINIEELAFKFFHGIAKYIGVLLVEPTKRANAATRLEKMFQEFGLNTEK